MNEQITVTSAAGVKEQLDLVALGGRSYAFVLDWHFRFLAALIWILVSMLVVTGGNPVQNGGVFTAGTGAFYLVWLPALLIYFLYHPVLEVGMSGQTPGKRMAGIRIVANDGGNASSSAMLIRNLFRLIDSLPACYVLGMIVCFSSKRYLRLGDMAAGTVLVYDEPTVQKRLKLNMVQTGTHPLSPQQHELIAELLERWQELESPRRRQLAVELLQKIAQPVPQVRRSKLDQALQASLQRLLK